VVSPLKNLDTAIELGAVTGALLFVGGDAGGNRRLRALRLLVGGGRGDEQLTINLCGGVVLAPVAGVGDNDADRRVDVGRLEGLVRRFDHREELVAVDRVHRQLGGDDNQVDRRHGLAVVTLQEALAALHQPRIGIGDVASHPLVAGGVGLGLVQRLADPLAPVLPGHVLAP
jgi:hypothetical protein